MPALNQTKRDRYTKTMVVILALCIGYFMSPIFSLIISFFLVLRSKRESFVVSFFAGFSIAYPALFYVPLESDDANRILSVVNSMKDVSITNLLNWLQTWAPDYVNYPLFTGAMFFVAKNFQTTVLPFLVIGIAYSLVIFSVKKFSRIFKISNVVSGLTIFSSLLWINFLELISGMRFVLACCIVLLIILERYVYSKRALSFKDFLWFIVPMCVHPGVVLVIIPLLIMYVVQLKKSFIQYAIGIAAVGAFGYFISLSDYFSMLLKRFSFYKTNIYIYIFTPQKLLHLVIGVFIGILCMIQLKTMKDGRQGVLFDRLYLLIKSYLIYYLIMILSMNFAIRLNMVMPIIFILGIAACSSQFLFSMEENEQIEKDYFSIGLLLFLIFFGVIYNVGIFKINFDQIKWMLPFV